MDALKFGDEFGLPEELLKHKILYKLNITEFYAT